MPLFSYEVMDIHRKSKCGIIEAANEMDAVKKLQAQSFIVLSCKVASSSKQRGFVNEFKRKLLLIKGLLCKVSCFKCKKQLGSLSIKKMLDDNFMCNSCFEAMKIENRKIIFEIIGKYLSNKDDNFHESIRVIFSSISNIGLEPHSLDKAKNFLQINLSSSKIIKGNKEIDDFIYRKTLYENSLTFLTDLEKMRKLLKNKGVNVDYLTILDMFVEFMNRENDEMIDEMIENAIPVMHKIIIDSFGKNVSKEMVVTFLVKGGWRFDFDFKLKVLYKLLDKLNLSFTKEEIEKLITETKERIELEKFEQNLGSQKRVDSPREADMGDFRNLNGHAFEEYAQKLFGLLGYTVVRTALTGDQGADLIISKDETKTVVQAKKYTGSVSNKAIQEVVAAKSYYKAEKAVVVTNSSFTKGAIELALANNVELWDGEKLENIVKNLGVKKEQVLEQIIACSSKEDKKIIVAACPLCKKEFQYEMNLEGLENSEINKVINFRLICPFCGAIITAQARKTQETFSCQYCSQKFDTKGEVDEHVNKCKSKV